MRARKMPENQSSWLVVDEQTDVISSLSVCLLCLTKIHEDPAFWKHVIITLYNALQGAMVCHLSGTAQLGALDDTSFKKTIEWHERDRNGQIEYEVSNEDGWPIRRSKSTTDQFPSQRLADAGKLFTRLGTEEKRLEPAGQVVALTKSHKKSFEKLRSLRNDFSHFTPKGWSIELAGLPRICLDCLAVMQMIANDGWAFRHLNEDKRAELGNLLQSLMRSCVPE